jgi:diacylglycerol kinase family enzyme
VDHHAEPRKMSTGAAKVWRDGLLMVVGGDGRISEVVNGLGKADFSAGVTLAILPAGTGNDLVATLAIPEDPNEARAVLRQNRVRTLDAVPRANSEDGLLDLVVIEEMGVPPVLKLAPTVVADSDYHQVVARTHRFHQDFHAAQLVQAPRRV